MTSQLTERVRWDLIRPLIKRSLPLISHVCETVLEDRRRRKGNKLSWPQISSAPPCSRDLSEPTSREADDTVMFNSGLKKKTWSVILKQMFRTTQSRDSWGSACSLIAAVLSIMAGRNDSSSSHNWIVYLSQHEWTFLQKPLLLPVFWK